MVKEPNGTSDNVQHNLTCPENRVHSGSVPTSNPEHHQGFDWDEYTRGQVLGALAIGYLTTNVRITYMLLFVLPYKSLKFLGSIEFLWKYYT